tara:strand:+ start:238 stop:507 length:270 start_codon:yes stop_codon:yes gene_type:complete
MEKFIVFGKYCKDAIHRRKPYREEHLNRLSKLKEQNILITLGPTKCSKYLFAILNGNNENEVRDLLEKDIYWEKGIWISLDIYSWIQAF